MVNIINSTIDPNINLLTIYFDDNTKKEININDQCENNLQLIYNANITYRGHQYKWRNLEKYKDSVWGGCLPSVCLHINEPSVNLSTRYLINAFIEHMSLLFKDDNDPTLFERDDKTIPIPISIDDMQQFYDKMLDGLMNMDENEINNNNNNNMQLLMKMVLQFLLTIKEEGEKNLSDKKLRKIKKSSNIVGRYNYQQIFEQLNNDNNGVINKEDIAKNLKESTANIQNFIRENREAVKNLICQNGNLENSAFHRVIEVLKSDGNTPLYIQYNISFDQMFETIGQIMNAALYTLIPKTSFILALQACFYNSAFLYALNVLDKYTDVIFLPMLHRLTFSCFKSDVNEDIERVKEYMNFQYSEIVDLISKLGEDADRNVDILTKISLKINMRDEKCLDGLFWLLNEMRGYSIEYYLVLLAHIFQNTNRCKTLNRHNKKSNIAQFIRPLYNIFCIYKSYVTGVGLDVAISSKTLELFNTLYSDKINEAISHFSSHLIASR